MDSIYRYVFDEILKEFCSGLTKFPLSCATAVIHLKIVQCFQTWLLYGQQPSFYERVLKSFNDLNDCFEEANNKNSYGSQQILEEKNRFLDVLQKYALSTEQLQLCFFLRLTQMLSSVIYLLQNLSVFYLCYLF